jgi:hypothetical protein
MWQSAGTLHTDPLIPAPCHTAEIREQLARILETTAFRASHRLARFITFVVEDTLAGKSDRIKAYTIAIEALGRSSAFDPQSDPIVRVEAGRLRRALAHYYAGMGQNDPIVIDVPRGGYVPSFRRRGGEGPRFRSTSAHLHAEGQSITKAHPLAEIAERSGQLIRSLARLQELFDIQRLQVTAATKAMETALRALTLAEPPAAESAAHKPAAKQAANLGRREKSRKLSSAA